MKNIRFLVFELFDWPTNWVAVYSLIFLGIPFTGLGRINMFYSFLKVNNIYTYILNISFEI